MILIFGSNGMLGNYIFTYLKEFYEIISINRKDFDVYELFIKTKIGDMIDTLLEKYKPKYVINCIGNISKTNYSSNEPNKHYIINSYFPVILSIICKNKNIILIHPTTDCVYSGRNSLYSNDCIPDPVDDYGLSKFLGENIHACIIRVSIIGEEKYNSRSLINWIKSNKNKIVNGYVNHFWNGITCLEYAKFIYSIIRNNNCWVGIKNLSSNYKKNNFISKYELIKIISDIYQLNINVIPFETSNKCDRTLRGDIIIEKDLYDQLVELKNYEIF